MAKIHQLSVDLSNQIAAGEVIERPASVVKELVENSIDAGATQIDVRIQDAGLSLVQVQDNGSGIEAEDVPTAFLRHATSKILTTRDLFNVHSLGFRGEALASIAAVAKVQLETATESGIGTKVAVEGGQMEEPQTVAVRPGTQIKVQSLFYNTPARLKYVKSQQTELAKIVDILNRLALANPQIAFTLRNDNNLMLKTAGHNDLQQTLAGIYGVNVAKAMVGIEAEDLDFKVTGYTSLPDTTRASRNYLSLMINGRYIKNYQLTKALIAGYGSKLMVGRYPVAVLDIQMDPLLVDVNVHPTKQEVRLSKEDQLGDLIEQAVRQRFAQQNLIPDALHNLQKSKPLDMDQLALQMNAVSAPIHEAPAREKVVSPPTPTPTEEPRVEEDTSTDPDYGLDITQLDGTSIFKEPERLAAWDDKYNREPATQVSPEPVVEEPIHEPQPTGFPELRFLAQMHGTFLLAEGPDGFYIVDQHAAQERVNYEYYRQAIGEVSNDQQRLLVPIVLDYPASDAVSIREHRELLADVGVILEDFGQNTFIVQSHPTWFKEGQEEATIREMIDWVLKDGRISVAKFREATAIMMSCRRAIKANHHLDAAQASALLTQLTTAENPYNCPHGRPVLIHFSDNDLNKMFKRIQDSHESGVWE
ncbi:DNA mismatch repair endonuclease MutL [Lacticaseibacillus saniviri]|uniref:DNA mismatch repair protein MutL n=1 Tax=Lacticaseibacillus saniviri JCM 17471 = DSM 24301 TaxID=1293598 RepID=A0A0R2MWH6_9LACO|nr:DNA mismatch repair endonuclease MutL [Lacticaseibacillus saniviri]KRO17983.1 DNA mismatch repair protein [Lacticaseibacillus saniviri JCM 17471 = DSM 24301]MCG4281988.1 DNA mismatch repair endonuclease MutL [Lacticaseibacillus saniviri]